TSGHYLSIDDNVIVKTKEWLLDPDSVEIKAPDASRENTSLEKEFPTGKGTRSDPKKKRPPKNNTNQQNHFKFSEKCQSDEYNGSEKTYR
ncbi:hypothetical protein ACPQX8_001875, partial [Haemophilus influenzae]